MRGNDELQGIGDLIDKLQQEAVEKYKKEHGWIPCSERLPDRNATYVITAKDEDRTIVSFMKWQSRLRTWSRRGRTSFWEVIAWMPLPKPYREDRDDE